jgi:hypothetical protein
LFNQVRPLHPFGNLVAQVLLDESLPSSGLVLGLADGALLQLPAPVWRHRHFGSMHLGNPHIDHVLLVGEGQVIWISQHKQQRHPVKNDGALNLNEAHNGMIESNLSWDYKLLITYDLLK